MRWLNSGIEVAPGTFCSCTAQAAGPGAYTAEELAAQLRDAAAENDALAARLAAVEAECDTFRQQWAPDGGFDQQLFAQLHEATADVAVLTAKVASLTTERDTLMQRLDHAGIDR